MNPMMERIELEGDYFEDTDKLMEIIDKLSAEICTQREEMHYIALGHLQECEAENLADQSLDRSKEVLKEVGLIGNT